MKYILPALIGLFMFAGCEESSKKSDEVLSAVFNNYKEVKSSKLLKAKEIKAKLNDLLGEDLLKAYGDLFKNDDILGKWLELDLGEDIGVLVLKRSESCQLYFIGDDKSIFTSNQDTGGGGDGGGEEPDPGTTDGGTVNVTCCTYPTTCIVNCVPGDCDNACDACLCECPPDDESGAKLFDSF